MFENKDGEWLISGTQERIALVHQDYFINDPSNKFLSKGTDWDRFHKIVLNLMIGN